MVKRASLKKRTGRCGKYSGGNKRKLCLAIAFMGDPALVVLDEPSAGASIHKSPKAGGPRPGCEPRMAR